MSAVAKAALIAFPIMAFDETGIGGVARIAMTGSAQAIAVPERFWGLFCNIRPVGASVQFGFSVAVDAISIVQDQTAAWGVGSVFGGATLLDGEIAPGIVPPGSRWLNFIASGGSSFLEIYVSEHLGVSK